MISSDTSFACTIKDETATRDVTGRRRLPIGFGMPRPQTVQRLRPFGSTIFSEMTELAIQHDAVNLGQGFPDSDGPAAMLEVARHAIADGRNQYPPGRGTLELRRAIAQDRATRYGTQYDPNNQVLVTVGATEAISAAVLGLVEPGSEVVLIEPYYDSYAAAIALAGAHSEEPRHSCATATALHWMWTVCVPQSRPPPECWSSIPRTTRPGPC